MADAIVDASGLLCPLPVAKAARAMRDLAAGQVLKIVATDPASPLDIAAWAGNAGHALETTVRDSERFVFLVRKGP